MYAYIRGMVDQVAADRAVLEAAGVGYELLCSGATLKRLATGREARLYTHLHLAEGVMALYGFYDTAERDMFRRLIGITRIGPKVALSVLSVLSPADVAAAVVTQNAAAFERVPGMGKKTAQRVLLELKEKVETSEMAGASGTCSHAEGGSNTTASGSYSHAEGAATRAEGHYAHAEGYNSIAEGAYSHASGYFAYALDYQTAIGICNDPKSVVTFGAQGNGTLFVVGNGVNATRRNVFRVQQDGKCFGTGSWNTSGAGYAEMFEWVDGNEANEDRRGLFVTLDGEKIRLATSNDDYVLGVISANPVILGDNDDDWHGRYLKDVFGQRIYESYINEEGETVERWKVNPDYDPEKQKDYVLREDRKEWAKVGMLGKILVVDDGTCGVNGYCYPGARGIGTKAETGYRVMKRIDDTHVTVLIR